MRPRRIMRFGNTMVMTGKVGTFWRLGSDVFPELIEKFERLGRAIGTTI